MAGLGVELVSVVNKLQDAFASVGSGTAHIDLPEICVLGSQSSGKSSVLENIVGRDFLPRGHGIVTRRPLVLQLINNPAVAKSSPQKADGKGTSANQDEWGEFLHLPRKKFFNFDDIRQEIVRDTQAKTGRNAGISPLPINLRMYSPHVLTLTLVDLPGLTKVPVGDQPRDIETQIRDMLMTYIARPACIILAVTPANQDLANSEGLKMAREVDPDGVRTIGVLTKVDLMDAGTDVVDILAGRVIPLRLGYVPVVNRGQRDIDSRRPISAALEEERKFFENHPAYKSNAKYCGTPYLAHKLNSTLKLHIRTTLPAIKTSIAKQHQKLSAELQTLGGPVAEGESAGVLLGIIIEFTTQFRAVIEGTSDLNLTELSGGARIAFVFHQLFNVGIKNIDPFDQVVENEIRMLLCNSSGMTPTLFVGTSAFENVVRKQIARLEEPSLKCCQLVYDELIRIQGELLAKMSAFRRYPALCERFNSVVVGFLKKSMGPTIKLVSNLVAMQACYINTMHPEFIGGHKATSVANERLNTARPTATLLDSKTGKLAQGQINNDRDLDVEAKKEDPGFFSSFFSKGKSGGPATQTNGQLPASTMEAPPAAIRPQATLSERETLESEIIKLLIHSYFNIVKREMIDTVPKAISLTLVGNATRNLHQELLQELYKPEAVEELLKESDAVVTRRREVAAMVQALNKAEE
ncbi:Dynamin central region-domain-containing protein [Mycena alexandri]|uniref:Vacuolar protein sorting-associated protein 1 n=1 Tax=Mycena alexandri TaxID=1745969 RepID=A0AAD6SF75_9AGAR|nr:Dynamin central region-domain-containing protein [Mycena alexandri]